MNRYPREEAGFVPAISLSILSGRMRFAQSIFQPQRILNAVHGSGSDGGSEEGPQISLIRILGLRFIWA